MSAFRTEYEHAKQEGIHFHWWVTQIDPLPYDMVITAIGQSHLRDLSDVNRETGQTSNPKYFAGGDCINGGREVVDAVADGKRAAQGIKKWLS
jgi:glutamate synthase (NADPH/NADH) small chain